MHLCAHRKRSRRMCNSLLIRHHPWWGVASEVIGNWPCFTLEPSVLDFFSFNECILNTFRISKYYVVKASKLINISYFQKFIRNLSGKPQSLLNTWQGALSWIRDFHFCAQNFWPVRAHAPFWVFPHGVIQPPWLPVTPTPHLVVLRFPEPSCLSPVLPFLLTAWPTISPPKGGILPPSRSSFPCCLKTASTSLYLALVFLLFKVINSVQLAKRKWG